LTTQRKTCFDFLGGFTCADMLRQNGFRGRILLFTREGTLPYDRVNTNRKFFIRMSHCFSFS